MQVEAVRESEILTRRRCEEIFGAVTDAARSLGVDDVEALIGGTASALTRFANNTIHQNVAERGAYLSVRALINGRTARATTNRMDRDSIRKVVEEAVAITKAQASDPALLPLAEPGAWTPVHRFFTSTAEASPESRAAAVAEAIDAVEAASQTAAGIYSTSESAGAILNARGVFTYHAETIAQFSITALAPDSSGWAKASACDADDLKPLDLALRAAQKARDSASPVEIAPGRYTVILEPAAVLDLVGQMFGDFSATAMRDERSFLTGRLGEKIFGNNIQIYDNVYHPLQAGAPFDGEGVSRQTLKLVERGFALEVAYSRQAAVEAQAKPTADAQAKPTGHAQAKPTGHGFPLPNEYGEAPMNIVIAGGHTSVEEMIASTQRGVLVTRLWYIREVDPYEKIMTGMTRDGTFLVENGHVTRGLRNFRFNQSLIELLSNVEELSPSVRTSGEESADMVVPAMKVRDFHFTEVTRF